MDITVQELRQKLDSGEQFLLLDVREPWEYEEFNIGGKLVPVGSLMNQMWELEEYKISRLWFTVGRAHAQLWRRGC